MTPLPRRTAVIVFLAFAFAYFFSAVLRAVTATLANLHGNATGSRPFTLPGTTPLAASQRVTVAGRRADGTPVRGEAAYFARGSQVFQAVVYAADPRPEWLQPFFDGLKFE